jgi:hypothetical protein
MRRTFYAHKVVWKFKDADSIEYQNGVDVAMLNLSLGHKRKRLVAEATIKQTNQNC